jgi:hypothetical protein
LLDSCLAGLQVLSGNLITTDLRFECVLIIYFLIQIVKLEREKEALEEKIFKMEKENALLKEKVTAQESHLEEMKRTSLTKAQTVSLLQELVLSSLFLFKTKHIHTFSARACVGALYGCFIFVTVQNLQIST